MRLGIFGGTFDPVHYGHLLLAECCREQCGLDQVRFLPAALPPHKQQRELTPASQRIEMLNLAIGGHDAFVVSPQEIERGGVSYTVETLDQVTQELPDATIFFLMGGDSLRDLPTWREPARICHLAIPTFVRRSGSPEPDFNVLAPFVSEERLTDIKQFQVEMPVVELSSTDLRHRANAGRSLRYRVPRAVEKYIETQGLYRD